jgi:thioredoxin-dependent peroxiredoxin
MAGPKVGDPAPEFELPGSGGKTYRLADYRGSGVILAFYPGDFTPTCTRQFCSYRDEEDKLEELGVELLGISPQSVDSHERFIAENSLNVPLLADEDKGVARAYGTLLLGGLVRRSIFVLDAELIVRHRQMSTVGLGFESADDLQEAVATIR